MIGELLTVLVVVNGQDPEIAIDSYMRLQSSYMLISNNQLYLQAPQPNIISTSTNYAALLAGNFGGVALDVESGSQMGGSALFTLGMDFNSNYGQPIYEMVDAVFRVEFASMEMANTLHFVTTNSNPQMAMGTFDIDFEGDGIFDWSSDSGAEPKNEHQFFSTSYSILVKVRCSATVSVAASKIETLLLRNIPGGRAIEPVRVGVEPHLLDWERGLTDTTFLVTEQVVPVVLVVGNRYFPSPIQLGPMPNGTNLLNVSFVPEEFHYIFNWPQPGMPVGQSSFVIQNQLLNQLPPLMLQAFVFYPSYFIAGNILEVNV